MRQLIRNFGNNEEENIQVINKGLLVESGINDKEQIRMYSDINICYRLILSWSLLVSILLILWLLSYKRPTSGISKLPPVGQLRLPLSTQVAPSSHLIQVCFHKCNYKVDLLYIKPWLLMLLRGCFYWSIKKRNRFLAKMETSF